jgi:bacillithiol biosynthesis cysteine-adding enzyme BshC
MKSECLAFTAIPHTSNLFRDYLYNFERVQRFYAVNPRDYEALGTHGSGMRYDYERRKTVADILERQNREFDASAKALENTARLRAGAVAAVSGQQVCLFGGPLYSILKAVSAIRLARDLTAKGTECVPVFWLATEDHDLAEVNHVTLLNSEGLPERVETSSHAAKDTPVSEVRFGDEINSVTERACALLGDGELADFMRVSYRPGESLGTAFGKLFAKLFADFGLVLLDASDKALHQLAKPVYRAVIEGAEKLNHALIERGKALRAAGYHEQVKVTSESTVLFEKRDGARTVIHRNNDGFSVARQHFTADELLSRIDAEPHRFSANVLLRPSVQDFLLPTIGYFAGPAEVAYFAQVAVAQLEVLGRVTPVVPRLSATLLDARAQRLMKKYGIALTDLFAGPEATRELLAAKSLPTDLHTKFEQSSAAVTDTVAGLRKSLEKLDHTLTDATERAHRKMLYQLDRLRKRAANAELRRNGEIARHAEWLSANLYPGKELQEREIAGISFLARYGRELLSELVECAGCPDHEIVQM